MKVLNNKKAFPLLVLILTLTAACEEESGQGSDSFNLPRDPSEWVCESNPQLIEEDVRRFCASTTDFGSPAPDILRSPSSILTLEDKNSFDLVFRDFLRQRDYINELNWIGDRNWRLTGPYVGKIGSGLSFGIHPAVRVYYSPEVTEWLCNNREGELPDGSMIIKSMHSINEELDITLDNQGCMVIQADVEPDSWTIIIKDSSMTHDGWYWGKYSVEVADPASWQIGNPPIFGLSAATNDQFPPDSVIPMEPNPLWYPTGYDYLSRTRIPSIAYPFNQYGNYCLNCHSSAINEHTFASLDNVVSGGIRYRQFDPESEFTDLSEDITYTAIHLPGFEAIRNPRLAVQSADNPFSPPLTKPTDKFLDFYSQLDEVTFSDVWPERFPAETYDHVVSGSESSSGFLTSDQCQGCHDATFSNAGIPEMVIEKEVEGKKKIINLSVYGEWKASPMGLAGRDPIFFAQLQSETNIYPELAECIESSCLHCHVVMGQRQFALDNQAGGNDKCKEFFAVEPPEEVPFGDKAFRRKMVAQWPGSVNNENQIYGALARDGISCTVCHRISNTGLGDVNTYTGNFVSGPPGELYGPYETVTIVQKPMQNAIGKTPLFGEQTTESDLCGSCHNILLPQINNDGEIVGAAYEQTTHLEWLNSDFAPGRKDFRYCQNCHMPTSFEGKELSFKIANIESDEFPPTTNRLADEDIKLTRRNRFSRHSLHGLNIFLNEMFQEFPILLGYRQIDYMTGTAAVPPLITNRNSIIEMSRNETAEVEIEKVEVNNEGMVEANIKIINKAGHYLPSGVSFRRLFIEFLVRDSENNILWASGRTNSLGAILNGTNDEVLESEQPVEFPEAPFQPHYQIINSEDQVQIYQELIKDSDGNLTTSFLRRIEFAKDNRIRPKGYDPEFFNTFESPFIQTLSQLHGEAVNDPYYFDPALTGADKITYIADLGNQIDSAHNIQVTLYSQSIPPFYLQQRFRDANIGPAEKDDIERLYYLTSHLNVDAVTDEEGNQVLKDWKLLVSSETRELN